MYVFNYIIPVHSIIINNLYFYLNIGITITINET